MIYLEKKDPFIAQLPLSNPLYITDQDPCLHALDVLPQHGVLLVKLRGLFPQLPQLMLPGLNNRNLV